MEVCKSYLIIHGTDPELTEKCSMDLQICLKKQKSITDITA
jgi:hypothetical protein